MIVFWCDTQNGCNIVLMGLAHSPYHLYINPLTFLFVWHFYLTERRNQHAASNSQTAIKHKPSSKQTAAKQHKNNSKWQQCNTQTEINEQQAAAKQHPSNSKQPQAKASDHNQKQATPNKRQAPHKKQAAFSQQISSQTLNKIAKSKTIRSWCF